MRQTVLTAAVFIFMIFFGFTSAHADYTYATLDVPGASNTHALEHKQKRRLAVQRARRMAWLRL